MRKVSRALCIVSVALDGMRVDQIRCRHRNSARATYQRLSGGAVQFRTVKRRFGSNVWKGLGASQELMVTRMKKEAVFCTAEGLRYIDMKV